MRTSTRTGKVNPALVAVVPPIVFLAGLMVYNAFRVVVPSAFTVDQLEQVEALEIFDKFSPTTKTGLPIPQPQSIRTGGSSSLIITHPASNGDYLLVTGYISSGFMADKNPLDKMLHLKFNSKSIQVTTDGEAVEAVLVFPRRETKPLVADMPDLSAQSEGEGPQYFSNEKMLPVGSLTAGKFTSNNGMSVELGGGFGKSGTLNLGEVPQLNITLDAESSAWIELPRSVRVQHKAIGTEDLEIGLIIPYKDLMQSFTITMFGEEVATVP